MRDKILQGDCLTSLRRLPDKSINCCITSPPYYGLRDYGHNGQIGLEETPDEYVNKLVEVFREVRRSLKDDGTLWLNLGDSYSGSGKGRNADGSANAQGISKQTKGQTNGIITHKANNIEGIKPKDLIGIPWMVAFALRADGWYLRQDIIWHKPNPMPESVQDRCTKAHEYVFLLSKSQKYYYDNELLRENCSESSVKDFQRRKTFDNQGKTGYKEVRPDLYRGREALMPKDFKRNRRSVWSISTKPYREAHFATFPEALIEPMVLAGCPIGGIVLDPFMGAGTTAVVAKKNNRNYIGCELNEKYVEIAEKRISDTKINIRLF